MSQIDNPVNTLKAACSVTDFVDGRVFYAWQDGDTDTAGIYNVEFEIHWGSEIQTIPNDTYIQINIVADLG